jgi:hypothetical protein
MAQHHVVHGTEFGGVERGVVRVAHGEDVPQGLPVALDLKERLLVGREGLFTIDRRRGVIFGDVVALNAVRAADVARQRRTAQAALRL